MSLLLAVQGMRWFFATEIDGIATFSISNGLSSRNYLRLA